MGRFRESVQVSHRTGIAGALQGCVGPSPGFFLSLGESAAGQGGDHSEEDGHLDTDEPGEVAGDSLIEGGHAAAEVRAEFVPEPVHFTVQGVDPTAHGLDPGAELLTEAVDLAVEGVDASAQERRRLVEPSL